MPMNNLSENDEYATPFEVNFDSNNNDRFSISCDI